MWYIIVKGQKEKTAMSAKNFGKRLRDLRKAASLTQTQLAEKAGIGRSFVAKMEGGLNAPSWESVQALAKALGVSCEAFNEPAEPPAAKGKKKGKQT